MLPRHQICSERIWSPAFGSECIRSRFRISCTFFKRATFRSVSEYRSYKISGSLWSNFPKMNTVNSFYSVYGLWVHCQNIYTIPRACMASMMRLSAIIYAPALRCVWYFVATSQTSSVEFRIFDSNFCSTSDSLQ